MKIRNILIASVAVTSLVLSATANATPVSLNVSGVFNIATGSLSGLLNQSYASNFRYDTDTSLARPGSLAFDPANGGDLGVAFCDGALGVDSCSPYTVTPSINGGQLYTGGQTVVEINHNVYISSAQNGGLFPAGTYDVLAVNGWAALGPCYVTEKNSCTTIGNGGIQDNNVNFEVDFLGNFITSTVTPSAQMPGTVDSANVILALVHIEKWENGVKTGVARQVGQISGSANNFAVTSAVPVPAAAWLLGSGLLGLIGVARRKLA